MNFTKETMEQELFTHLKGLYELADKEEISEEFECLDRLERAQLDIFDALLLLHNPERAYFLTDIEYSSILENFDEYLNEDTPEALLKKLDSIVIPA